MPITAANLLERILCLVNESSPESTKTNLDQSTVEENLGVDVEVADCLLKMRHQHHIARLVVVIVKCQEVDLAQHCPSPNDALAVLEEIRAKGLDERGGVVRDLTRSDSRVKTGRDRFPCVGLEDCYNLRWLENMLAACGF